MDLLKQLSPARARTSFFIAVLLWPLAAHASDMPTLQLAVLLNGQSISEIASFRQGPHGRLYCARNELEALGIKVPGTGPSTEDVNLDDLSGLKYNYMETSQEIDFQVPDQMRVERHLDASGGEASPSSPSTGSLVVNYSALISGNYNTNSGVGQMNGASLTLDSRASSKLGVVRQSGILSSLPDVNLLRLDTVWSYSDEDKLKTYSVGDFIGSGLSWTRPVRMAGIQVERNFGLRPGLVTLPLPSLRGSAAVPSTVDVYVNDIKSYSTDVGAGPFSIDNVPILTGSNNTRVVITDVTGRKTEQVSQAFTSPHLLRKGLFDYGVNLGVLRRSYGTESFDYDSSPAAVGDLRYGLRNNLTVEAHGEAMPGFINAGIGGYMPIGQKLGIFNAAVATSASTGGSGIYAFAGWQGKLGAIDVALSASRRLGFYEDLAAHSFVGSDPSFTGAVPVAREQVSVGYYEAALRASLHLSALHIEDQAGKNSYFAAVDFAKQMMWDATLFGNAYVSDGGAYGFGMGVSVPLGRSVQASVRAQSNDGRLGVVTEASRTMNDSPGSYGWRIANSQNAISSVTSGAVAYQSDAVRSEVGGTSSGSDAGFYAQADGAAVIAGDNLFLAHRIDDSFAVVDVGVPEVPVLLENRVIGQTNSSGKLLIPGLRSYQRNKISIDVATLPISANAASTELSVTPKGSSGVLADFGAKQENRSAIIVLTDDHGAFLAPGTSITLEATKEEALVGYDGRTFLTTLSKSNRILGQGDTPCAADFQFVVKAEAQEVIGPVVCRSLPEQVHS